MRFTILMSYSEAGGAALSPAEMEAGRLEFDAYGSALHEAGVLVAAEVFTPVASGLTVHGGTVTASTDASEQQLSGVFVIDVADQAAAVDWAKRCPAAAWGTLDVRQSAVSFVGGGWTS